MTAIPYVEVHQSIGLPKTYRCGLFLRCFIKGYGHNLHKKISVPRKLVSLNISTLRNMVHLSAECHIDLHFFLEVMQIVAA